MANAAQLIAEVDALPWSPIVERLWAEQEILGIHAAQEKLKTMTALTMAVAIAAGEPCLGLPVPRSRRVFFLETDMGVRPLAERLRAMERYAPLPPVLYFANQHQLRQFNATLQMQAKFSLIETWCRECGAEVLFLDTASDFFRGAADANDERAVGQFFDGLRSLPVVGVAFVRHNRKSNTGGLPDAAEMRGSGVWSSQPDVLLAPKRVDGRTHQIVLEVTKFRNGKRPDPIPLWYDDLAKRMSVADPIWALFADGKPRTRGEALAQLESRFGIGQSKADELLARQPELLRAEQRGHERVFTPILVPSSAGTSLTGAGAAA